jgi:hypothetical protein
MPNVQWEWKLGPQVIISGLNLLVMLAGIIYALASIETDVKTEKEQVAEVRSTLITLGTAQQQQAVDGATVRAKVDLILPMVEKLNDVAQQMTRH